MNKTTSIVPNGGREVGGVVKVPTETGIRNVDATIRYNDDYEYL